MLRNISKDTVPRLKHSTCKWIIVTQCHKCYDRSKHKDHQEGHLIQTEGVAVKDIILTFMSNYYVPDPVLHTTDMQMSPTQPLPPRMSSLIGVLALLVLGNTFLPPETVLHL